MRRLTLLFTFTLALTALFAFPALSQELKIATLSPEGTALVDELRAADQEIAAATEGRVRLKIYTGGVMGNDDTVLRKMRMGQLHGGFVGSNTLALTAPDYNILGLPLLVRTNEEADAVRAAFEEQLGAQLAENGLVSMGMIELGFVYIMSNRPITRKSDILGCKCWIPEGYDIGRDIFEGFGVTPIPLPMPDVLTALQTGLIDTVANAPSVTLALQWFTAVTHLTDYPLLYNYGSLVFSERAWSQLSPEDQAAAAEILTRHMTALNTQSRVTGADAMQALQNQGIAFVEPNAEDAAELQAIADQVIEARVASGQINRELLAQVREVLAAVRAGQ